MAMRIFIVGGGRFGTHLASRLSEFGCEVVISDNAAKRVEDLAETGFHAIEIDADDSTAMQNAGVREADAVVVAIGENMEASILTTLTLKELKVRKLIARAVDEKHAQVLQKLGADLVVLPSRDMAWQLAETLRSGMLSERVPISGDFQLANVRLNRTLDGQTLAQARLPEKFGITIALISRPKDPATSAAIERWNDPDVFTDHEPNLDFVLLAGDWLSVSGKRSRIDKFIAQCGEKF
ncbi:MAG TPA: TrkA family potassium uptake protein [Verrucomicrobiota bacterium]|nr:TrkA family potassium uptake protein [Verrucomicrobiota bacterium]